MANHGCLHPAMSTRPGVFELLAIDQATKDRVTIRTGPTVDASAVAAWKRLQRTLPRSYRWFGDFTRLSHGR